MPRQFLCYVGREILLGEEVAARLQLLKTTCKYNVPRHDTQLRTLFQERVAWQAQCMA